VAALDTWGSALDSVEELRFASDGKIFISINQNINQESQTTVSIIHKYITCTLRRRKACNATYSLCVVAREPRPVKYQVLRGWSFFRTLASLQNIAQKRQAKVLGHI
jgi:hypothetical protein